ncbi:MAG: hypothetical protein WC521_09025 [Bdellovibrionales bacterium]
MRFLAESAKKSFKYFVMRILSFFAALFFLCSSALAAGEAVPATAYFPVLPLNAPEDAQAQLVPLAMNRSLDIVHDDVMRAIIVIHDETRDATAALAMMAALAGSQNSSTVILAPQFLLPSDIVRFSDHLPDKGKGFAAWQVLGWSLGNDSMPIPSRKSVSSFTVVDFLLMYLSDRNIFPNLDTIVIAGHGVGANFVQRYAALTAAADILEKQNIKLRFVAAGATSYLYQTASRPMGGKKGFGLSDAAACPSVNAYPYGLEKLNPYGRHVGANSVKINYALRFITYLYAQAIDAVPDASCAAMAQGNSSASRAENYRMYLRTLYSDIAGKTQTFAKSNEGVNDAISLFGSACGMESLFGEGMCPPSMGAVQN